MRVLCFAAQPNGPEVATCKSNDDRLIVWGESLVKGERLQPGESLYSA